LSLEDLRQLLLKRNIEMIQVCSGWRKLLAPTFYQYCLYDGRIDAPLVPEEQICHIRKLLVYIPEDYCSYRNVVRGVFRLPMEVRRRIRWLGVCMNKRATISMSEMGALAEAFPNLQHVWADLAYLSTKLRDIYPVLIGTATPARVTVFVSRQFRSLMMNSNMLVTLIRRIAASLEYLDLKATLPEAYEVIWGSNNNNAAELPCFPRLRTLRIIFCALTSPAQLLARFPNLEDIRLMLLNPQVYLPSNEINYNLSLRRLWVNAMTDDLPMWNAASLESLVTLLARMPNLKELLLFDKAVEWLSKAISRKNCDELLWLSLGVNIGRCNHDEEVVRHTTTLFL
ncbi:hypothetical protein H4R20_004346, partial [Coemansia guatemalensis]